METSIDMNRDHGEIDVMALAQDPRPFNDLIYTSLGDALVELERRRQDDSIPDLVPIPDILKNGRSAVLFRQLITPNYEARRFISIIEATHLKPVFWEYYHDKFTSNNEWKHSLGKLFFYEGVGKLGGKKINSLKIIDFNTYNGSPIEEVQTLWGQSLIDFHHEFYEKSFRKLNHGFFDASDWFKQEGGNASSYYKSFLKLFIKHGILFDNFMLDEKEIGFNIGIFLPAFLEVIHETGLKPLIVSLEPTDIEGDQFWMCHPNSEREIVEAKLASVKTAV